MKSKLLETKKTSIIEQTYYSYHNEIFSIIFLQSKNVEYICIYNENMIHQKWIPCISSMSRMQNSAVLCTQSYSSNTHSTRTQKVHLCFPWNGLHNFCYSKHTTIFLNFVNTFICYLNTLLQNTIQMFRNFFMKNYWYSSKVIGGDLKVQ